MLKSPKEVIPECVEKIGEDYFYIPSHKTIYSELVDMWNDGTGIDLITLTERMASKSMLDDIGGASFVTHLFTFVPSADNIQYYLEIVRDKYILRQIISTAVESATRALNEQDNATGLLAETELKVNAIGKDSFARLKEKTLAEHIADKIERMESGEPDADIIFTKLKELDEKSPLRKGDMPLITGERKDGKSIFAISILENICIGQKLPGLIFSLEDRTPKVIDRIFAGVSRIPMNRHHVKKRMQSEDEAARKALEKIIPAPIVIKDDCFELSKIVAAFRKEFMAHPNLAVCIVDYAQLVIPPRRKDRSREQEVAEVSRTLRMLAMETGVPIILLSQLNAQGTSRESKALEQDATACWRIKQVKGEAHQRSIEIPWQRNGESGIEFKTAWFGEIARVDNLSRESEFATEEPKMEFTKKRA